MYETNPTVPQSVTALVTPGVTTVSWVVPSNNGGTDITSYRVVSSPAGYDSGLLSASTTSVTMTGLTNGTSYTFTVGTSYTFTVTVTNTSGYTNSAPSSAVTPFNVPGVPTGLTPTIGSGQFTLSWTAPVFTGESPITGYRIVNTTIGSTVTTAATSYVWSGLTNGSTYTFTVEATNNNMNYGAAASITRSLRTPGFTYKVFPPSPAPTISFSAAAAGSINYGGGSLVARGGGGAGGVNVSGYSPASGSGSGSDSGEGVGGYGGSGFGAGGGGSNTYQEMYFEYYWRYYSVYPPGGQGASGFAYFYLDYYNTNVGGEVFYTNSSNYTFLYNGVIHMILMGGGSGGSADYSQVGGGGSAGYLQTYSVTVTAGQTASITIGNGGYASAGGATSVVINGISYTASGAGVSSGNTGTGGGSSAGGTSILNGSPARADNAGSSAGNGIGGQGTAVFSAAMNFVSATRISKYFADDLSRFTIWLPKYTGSSTDMTSINAATGGIIPNNGSFDNYSIEWFGYFLAPSTGSYTFYTASKDASYVWIGSNAVSGYTTANSNVNNGGIHNATDRSGTLSLTAGTYYPIRCQFGAGTGADSYTFSFTGPSITRTYNMTGYVFNW
jgi:hypothetical protein